VTNPDPARHPILLFDGVCNLCHGGVRFVLDHDRAARFRFAPLQSDVGRALVAESGRDPDALGSMLLIDADGAHEKSAAILRAARALGAPWSWSWPLMALPVPWRDAAYDWIARNRYRWFGKKDTCPTPRPEWKHRFLETEAPITTRSA
jgi:predicted DCC family thiol-disulfide oxidoreductase YuxK